VSDQFDDIDPAAFDAADDIDDAAAAVREGQLVVYPTETVYGLAADATDPDAVARVFAAKGRGRDKPVSLAVPDVDAALEYVDPTDREALRQHLERFAGAESVVEATDGTLTAEFSRSTTFAVAPDGRVESEMPLHGFGGPADEVRFDHDAGEIHVTAENEAVSYTFRRP